VDLNPLHWIDKINEQIGHSTADVLEFIGITNPAVDPDGIREIARNWKALGEALDDANWHVGQALGELRWEGASADALHSRAQDVRKHCEKASDVLRQGHDQLNKFADEAHELISQIGVLCAQILEFELAALPLTLLTGPLSEVASNLAAGERAAKILALIARIAEAAKTVDRVIEAILEALGALGRALRMLAPIAKMAAGGIAMTLGYDAIANPDRLRHADTLEQDVEAGALLGIITGGFGKGLQASLERLGPRLMPALAGAGILGDLGGKGDAADLSGLPGKLSGKWDELLSLLQRNYEDKWPRGGAKPPLVRPIDLGEEEALGGHTIDRHVGKTDQYLRDRLEDSDIEKASSFSSYMEAQKYVNAVMQGQKVEIETWLKSGKKPTEDFSVKFGGAAIGKSLTREEWLKGIKPHPVDRVTIVIRRDPGAPDGYKILTAFPAA
jgi:hypothetical protein